MRTRKTIRSAGVAIAWELCRRHRWGFAALAAYLLLAGTTDLLILEPGQALRWDGSPDVPPRLAATVVVPVSILAYYFLAAFSFGLSGDVAARQSMYPARMFTLPVTTAALAFWPMLYGTATLATLLMVTTRFVAGPSGVDLPLIWPALFAAATVAWTQALMWMPYGLPGLRVIIAVLWLATIDAAVFTAIVLKVPENVMVAVLAPQIPLAYLAARFAVARARRGDVPDWRGMLARLGQIVDILPRSHARFRSAAHAQAWFEWRQHGRSLPVWVGILVPCELALLFVAGKDMQSLIAYTLAGVLLTPPFMAAFVAASVRRPHPRVSESYGIAPFTATRPLASAALIAAKLRMAIWSTLAAWLLVLIAIPAALTLSDTWPVVIARARQLSDGIGAPRTVVVGLLGVSGLVAWTWRQLVQGLYVGLGGREWLIRSSTCLTLTALIFIEPIVQWIRETSDVRVALWNALPWILGVLACCKTSAAAWIATRLYRSRVLSDRTLVTGATCWVAVVLALFGLFTWVLFTPFFPRYVLGLVAILAVPLARVSAAPLALAWNRHR